MPVRSILHCLDFLGHHDPAETSRFKSGLAQLGPLERFVAIYRYTQAQVKGKLLSLTLEVTKRCMARCDFCDHWQEPKQDENTDFAAIVRHFDPLTVIFCGGEPLLRKDIVEIIERVVAVPGWRYYVLITNGWLLTPELGLKLHSAGLHQINVSLNWPDARQDEERKLKGLFQRIATTVPTLTAKGIEVNLNTMIMRDNLSEITTIARLAHDWGAKVTFTLYSEYCNGNETHQCQASDLPLLQSTISELIALKSQNKNITNNNYYLRECVSFCQGKRIPDCPAGKKMLHITPQGIVKPCADLPAMGHYSEFNPRKFPGVSCDICWMACRGEVQAPVNLERVREVVGF